MSRSKLSPTELLDMAREVLNVCSHHALKDILEDLEITNSSEQTINRILDGQVNTRLQSLVPKEFAFEAWRHCALTSSIHLFLFH